jgi:hypothetical protein
MNGSVIVWGLETVPDLCGLAAYNNLVGKTNEEIRKSIGDKFPKHIYHSIVCIGALVAREEADRWVVDALGAPTSRERSEKQLASAFVARIAELNPQLETFNGTASTCPSCGIAPTRRLNGAALVGIIGNEERRVHQLANMSSDEESPRL